MLQDCSLVHESSQIATVACFMSQDGVTLWFLLVVATGHKLELLEEKLEKTGLESLEVCKAFP